MTSQQQAPAAPAPERGAGSGANDAMMRKYRLRFLRVWGYIGIGIIAIAVAFALGALGTALQTLFLGALLAFIYAPITNWLERKWGVPRLLGTFVGLLAVLLSIFLVFLMVVPPITEQASALGAALPNYVEAVQGTWAQLTDLVGTVNAEASTQMETIIGGISAQIESAAVSFVSFVGTNFFSGAVSAVSTIVMVFMAGVVSFWLAKDFPRIERELDIVVGPRLGEDYHLVTSVFGRSLGGYIKGLMITSTVTGIIAGCGFWFLGIPYSGILGILTAVLNVIPYVGPWVGGLCGFLVGLTVGWFPAVMSIVVTVCAQQFTDNFISPKVMQQAVSLHPVFVIVALLGGGAIGGIAGMILAVPLTAAAKGVFVYFFEKRTGRQLVSPDGALFRGRQFVNAEGMPRAASDALGVDILGDDDVPERIRKDVERRA